MLHSDWVRRLAVTVGIIAVWGLLTQIPLPGVTGDLDAWRQSTRVEFGQVAWLSDVTFSLLTLGAAPFVVSFLGVEAVAFALPASRAWVRGGPEQRAQLWWVALAVGLAVAVIQAFGMAIALEQMRVGAMNMVERPGWAFRIQMVAALLVSTALVAWGTRLMDQRGIGGGFAVWIGLESMFAVWDSLSGIWVYEVPPLTVGLSAVGLAVTTGVVLWAVKSPYPMWGTAAVVGWALQTLVWVPGVAGRALALLVMGLGSSLLVRAVRPALRMAAFERSSRPLSERLAAVRQERSLQVGWTFGLALLMAGPALLVGGSGWHPPTLAMAIVGVVVADWLVELRARMAETTPWVAVWPLHQPYLVPPALAGLAEANIPVLVRGGRFRALVGPFDPRVGVDVLVPADRSQQACTVLREALRVAVADGGVASAVGAPSSHRPEVADPWSPPPNG